MKLTLTLFISILILPIASYASVEGVWQCNVKTITTVKSNGKTRKGTDFGSSTNILYSDGSYSSSTAVSPVIVRGTYTVKKRSIKFYPNYSDLVGVVNHTCTVAGVSCLVSGVQAKSNGNVNRTDTIIKGYGTLNMSILMNGSVLTRSTGKSTSTCSKKQ